MDLPIPFWRSLALVINYVVPPLVGALIGYFTNYVAIKMLFKPTKPYYLLGKKLPFTPGLIPSKREKLAEAIAKVVKENLLTEEVLRNRLNSEEVKVTLANFVDSFLRELSTKSTSYIYHFVEKFEEKELSEVFPLDLLEVKITEAVDKLFSGLDGKRIEELLPENLKRKLEDLFNEKVEELVDILVEYLKSRELEELIYSAAYSNLERLRLFIPFVNEGLLSYFAQKATQLIREGVEKLSQDPNFKTKVVKLLWFKFQDLLKSELKTSGEIPQRLKSLLKDALSSYLKGLSLKKLSQVPSLNSFLKKELPPLLSYLIDSYREEIRALLTDKLYLVIERELPVIMESLDLESMVKEKINSLPIEEVEAIVLKLINEELNHITLLGGLLGFIIGLFQLIFLF